MKTYSVAVSTTEGNQKLSGSKFLLLTTGSVAVQVAFAYDLKDAKHDDMYSQEANSTYRYKAKDGKAFQVVFFKTASGSSTLAIAEDDVEIEAIA